MALTDSTNPMQGVSGPGKFSKRTDLEYQSQGYGDGVEYQAIKSGAPLATGPATPHATPTQVRQAAAQAPAPKIAGLFDQSERPHEPITHGVDVGAGAGSEALNLSQSQIDGEYQNAYQVFNNLASAPNASPSLKYLAQRIQQGF